MARSGNSRAAHASPERRSRPTGPIVGVAAGILLSAALVVALSVRRGSAEQASAEPPARATLSRPSLAAPTPAGPELAPPPTFAPTVEPQQPPAGELRPSLLRSKPTLGAADKASEAQPASFKSPSAYPQNIANRAVPRIGEKPWLISEEWRAHHERHLRAAGRATAKVVFLGDSITEGWGVAPAYRERFGKYAPLNLGIANDTTQNVLWRIQHGALDGTNPQAVVLMVGINNLAGGFSPEQTADGVGAIVTAIQTHVPAARVLLLGILPARQDAANPLRQAIKDANGLLQSQAKPGRVELLDVGSVMLEPDGSISKSTMRDFVHPTAGGFERLTEAMAPLLDALLDPPAQ